jgi:hypothetical protein
MLAGSLNNYFIRLCSNVMKAVVLNPAVELREPPANAVLSG